MPANQPPFTNRERVHKGGVCVRERGVDQAGICYRASAPCTDTSMVKGGLLAGF